MRTRSLLHLHGETGWVEFSIEDDGAGPRLRMKAMDRKQQVGDVSVALEPQNVAAVDEFFCHVVKGAPSIDDMAEAPREGPGVYDMRGVAPLPCGCPPSDMGFFDKNGTFVPREHGGDILVWAEPAREVVGVYEVVRERENPPLTTLLLRERPDRSGPLAVEKPTSLSVRCRKHPEVPLV